MRVFALVGKSGTGKSYQSMSVAREKNIDAIIDDGLLIFDNKILAGRSAKHEKNRMASVRRAILVDDEHVSEIKNAIKENQYINSVLIIGTSEKMVNLIAQRLSLPSIEQIIYIEDISNAEQIKTANTMRQKYGQHVIPASTFEVKRQFSGYFVNPLKLVFGKKGESVEKTVMRPTYSYLGEFRISPKAISDIVEYEVINIPEVSEVLYIKSVPLSDGCIDIDIDVSLFYPCDAEKTTNEIKKVICESIDYSTSIIVKNIFISIKALTV